MKKSMLALFGCALVAGSVMAAEVTGNNIAVVIKKDPVVSSNLYQFLIVPVKGFDITGGANATSLTLNELLPASTCENGTLVYKAADSSVQWKVVGGKWVDNNDTSVDANDVEIAEDTILWVKAQNTATVAAAEANPLVFCGEMSTKTVSVTPVARTFVAFGNATSNAVAFSAISVDGGVQKNDKIYLVKSGASDYMILNYNGTNWTKPPVDNEGNPVSGAYIPLKEADKLPAGAAAYYYRR
jgi:hypothetical protein